MKQRDKDADQIFLKKLGARIKALRLKAGYTSQEVFAYECKIPRIQYSKYERGSNLTFLSLEKIVRFHKISWKDFFSEGFDE